MNFFSKILISLGNHTDVVTADGDALAVIIIIGVVIIWFFSQQSGSGSSSVQSNTSSGSSFNFSGNQFRTKIIEKDIKGEHTYELNIKGELLGTGTEMGSFSSILSMQTYVVDNEKDEPFYTYNNGFSDNASMCYMNGYGFGKINYNQVFPNKEWRPVGDIKLSDLVHPRKGNRKVSFVSFVVNNDHFPLIIAAKPYSKQGIVKTIKTSMNITFEGPGYINEIENNDEVLCSIVDLAVNVAKADDNFDIKEGEIIKKWMTEIYNDSLDENKIEMKKLLNDQFKLSFKENKGYKESINVLNEVAGQGQKFNAIELCTKVLTADGIEDDEETKMIQKIVLGLNLDYKEFLKRKEKIILESDVTVSGGCSEASVGIDNSWAKTKKIKFIKSEFIKWNGRLNTLKEGSQRESAQNKLNCLAKMRKEYE